MGLLRLLDRLDETLTGLKREVERRWRSRGFAAGTSHFVPTFAVRREDRAAELGSKILDEGGLRETSGTRLLTHVTLKPLDMLNGERGRSGLEAALKLGRLVLRLDCGGCRHRLFVEVGPDRPEESAERSIPEGGGYPGSFRSNWFEVWMEEYPKPASLKCPLCGALGKPGAKVLNREAWELVRALRL